MTRRSFLGGVAATLLCPSDIIRPARRTIDLARFCRKAEGWNKYDLSAPFVQSGHTYATDATVCVRVEPLASDVVLENRKLPPADNLSWWDHDRRQGWRDLDRVKVIEAEDWCPTCDGRGVQPPVVECDECEGYGCCECGGRGFAGTKCIDCNGHARLRLPCIAELAGNYFEAHYLDELRLPGIQYHPVVDGLMKVQNLTPLRFRFDGGSGLLMPLDLKAVQRIIEGA